MCRNIITSFPPYHMRDQKGSEGISFKSLYDPFEKGSYEQIRTLVSLNVPFLVIFVSQVSEIQSEISISPEGQKSALFQHFVPFNYHDFIFISRFLEREKIFLLEKKNVSPEFSGRFQGFWIIRSELWEIIFWSRIFNSIQGVGWICFNIFKTPINIEVSLWKWMLLRFVKSQMLISEI